MKLINKCLVCGGVLINSGDIFTCTSCNSVFKSEELTIDDAVNAVIQALNEKEKLQIDNARQNLFNELSREYLSKTEIKKYADILKSYYSEDVFGNFFSLACSDNISALAEYMSKTDWEKINKSIMSRIIDFLLRSKDLLTKNIPLILETMIESTYPRTSTEWQIYYKEYITQMKLVDSGFFDVTQERDCFVAYSSKDKKEVTKIVDYIESQGLKCFVAFRNLQHGSGAIENYNSDLEKAMDNSKIFVFISSNNSRDINCDAMKIEMEYITLKDKSNLPKEYTYIDYRDVPDIYKKPRVEFILEDYNGKNFAGENRANKFFASKERVYNYQDLIERIVTLRNSKREIPTIQREQIKLLSTEEKLQKNVTTFLADNQLDKAQKSIEIALNQDRYSEFANSLYLLIAEKLINKGEFNSAQKIVETVELNVPTLAKTYILKLLIKQKLYSSDDLIFSDKDLKEYKEFNLALKYAKNDYLIELKSYEMSVLQKIFDTAIKQRENGEFNNAIETFKKCGKYNNADIEINETIYAHAIYYKNSGDMVNAVSEFERCKGYKDSTDQINKIYYNAALHLKKEGNFALAIKEFEKCISYSDSQDQINDIHYLKANKLYKEQKFLDAIEELKLCINYLNSEELIYYNYYSLALLKKEQKRYSDAIEVFKNCLDYMDSENQIIICKQLMFENAKNYMQNGYYLEAISEFKKMPDNPDSNTYIEQCYNNIYLNGKEYMNKGNYDNAITEFKKCKKTNDSETLFKECHYLRAKELFKAKHYKSGEEYLRKIEGYKDSSELLLTRKNLYNKALKQMNKGNFASAVSIFSTLDGYKDSEKHITKCKKYIASEKMRKILKYSLSILVIIVAIVSIFVIIDKKSYKINVLSETECEIISPPKLRDSELVIPDTIKGKTVVSIGDVAFKNCSDIKKITIPDSVTKIGDNAFFNCSNLTDLTISENITTIGKYAFSNCNITNITIPKNITVIDNGTFYYCKKLTNITLPDTLTTINTEAFYGCNSLTEINIPNSITDIAISTFENCSNLKNIILPDSITQIGTGAFNGCTNLSKIYYYGTLEQYLSIDIGLYNTPFRTATKYYYSEDESKTGNYWKYNENGNIKEWSYLPVSYNEDSESVTITGTSSSDSSIIIPKIINEKKVTSIGNNAFKNNTTLVNITLPETITSIGSNAFLGCTNLVEITIPNNVTSINSTSFSGCTKLEKITLSNNLTSIASGAFTNCSNLNEITIPNSVTSIGSGAFKGCSNLTKITLPFIGDKRHEANDYFQYPFGYIFGTSYYEGGTSTQQYYYGASITNTSFTYYTIPNSLKEVIITDSDYLCYGAFYNCSNITDIKLPNILINIGNAFYNCLSITNVTIPDSVTIISNYAFSNCTNLIKVAFENTYGWSVNDSETDVSNPEVNATNLKSTYKSYTWKRK